MTPEHSPQTSKIDNTTGLQKGAHSLPHEAISSLYYTDSIDSGSAECGLGVYSPSGLGEYIFHTTQDGILLGSHATSVNLYIHDIILNNKLMHIIS